LWVESHLDHQRDGMELEQEAQSLHRASAVGDHAAALRASAALRRLADQSERQAVQRAREEGWSWREIGAALGVSAQAAHKRHRSENP
jgi:DNA-directed RNA polymerase specialized sigma24 family protein